MYVQIHKTKIINLKVQRPEEAPMSRNRFYQKASLSNSVFTAQYTNTVSNACFTHSRCPGIAFQASVDCRLIVFEFLNS